MRMHKRPNEKENLPPAIGDIQFNPSDPIAGNPVSAKSSASDPEDLPISWEWTWSGAEQIKRASEGNDLQLGDLNTKKTFKKEGLQSVISKQQMLWVHLQPNPNVWMRKNQDEPPQITTDATSSVGRMSSHRNIQVSGTGRDPDGDDNNELDWNRSGGGSGRMTRPFLWKISFSRNSVR